MRISDWSSDVCSSDLASACGAKEAEAGRLLGRKRTPIKVSTLAMDRSRIESHIRPLIGRRKEIGRASCRGKSVSVRVDLGGRRILKKKKYKQQPQITCNQSENIIINKYDSGVQ